MKKSHWYRKKNNAVYIPENFATGILSLIDNTIISYNCTGEYIPDKCGGIIWNDRELNVYWPIDKLNAPVLLSEKDKKLQTFYDPINIVGISECSIHRSLGERIIYRIYKEIFRLPYIMSYKKATKYFFNISIDCQEKIMPTIICGWDHTPRSGTKGLVLKNHSPNLFRKHAEAVIEHVNLDPNIIFLKSWNEWAEGNYIDPDLRFGCEYLNILRDLVCT
jgi:hypothetical protein